MSLKRTDWPVLGHFFLLLLGRAGYVVFEFVGLLIHAWGASTLWRWFVTPTFGWPLISFSQTAGLILLIWLIHFMCRNGLGPWPAGELEAALRARELEIRASERFGSRVACTLVVVGMGWLVKTLFA